MEFDPDMFEIANQQVTGAEDISLAFDQLCKVEYEAYKPFLNKPKKALDIGCGLGRAGVYLFRQLSNPHETEFLFADGTGKLKKDGDPYHWNPSGGWYNDLAMTSRFASRNGMRNFRTINIIENELAKEREIDLVISMLAVGFHYPIESYLQMLFGITSKECVFIFGIRDNPQKYSAETFDEYFKSCLIVNVGKSQQQTNQRRILILKDKICG